MTNNNSSRMGHFDIRGYFTYLGWRRSEIEEDFIAYHSTFDHEQFHFHQHIGTTFGHFLVDLQEIWVGQVVECVRKALEISPSSARFPISRWIESENGGHVSKILETGLIVKSLCDEIADIAFEGGVPDDYTRFKERYMRLINIILSGPSFQYWPLPRVPEVSSIGMDFEKDGWFGARALMELSASLAQLWQISSARHHTSSAEVAQHIAGDASSRFINIDLKNAWEREYNAAFTSIEQYLPSNLESKILTALALVDLALMTPMGRFHGEYPTTPSIMDLLPSLRYYSAARTAHHRGLSVQSVDEYPTFVRELGIDGALQWPQPAWLSHKLVRLETPDDNHLAALRNMQIAAAQLRIDLPHVFLHPNDSPLNELRVPTVLGPNWSEYGYSESHSRLINTRFFIYLVARVSVEGLRVLSEYDFIPDIRSTFDDIFESLFSVTIDSVEE